MWAKFVQKNERCVQCSGDGVLNQGAFAIFQKDAPRTFDILFILEAPNYKDTYNSDKGYLSISPNTDPSGRFFCDLFRNELKFPMEDLFISNSVLCLPAKKAGKYPVSTLQRRNCLPILRELIVTFNPIIVCPMGRMALIATDRIEAHGLKKMVKAVANPLDWYGRILFPLFHTSAQARSPKYGRPEHLQRSDWRKLRAIWAQNRDLIDGMAPPLHTE